MNVKIPPINIQNFTINLENTIRLKQKYKKYKQWVKHYSSDNNFKINWKWK